MKTNILKLTLAGAILGLAGGCGKKEESTAPSSTEPQKASLTFTAQVQKVVSAVDQTAKDVAQKATSEAEKLKTQVQEGAKEVTAQATAQVTVQGDKLKSQAQGLIDQASKLVAETKYVEAASVLKQLTSFQLTPEQQKLVDNLKTTVQKAVAKDAASEGAKAVGDLLGGKK